MLRTSYATMLAVMLGTTVMGQSPERSRQDSIAADGRASWQPVRDLSQRRPRLRSIPNSTSPSKANPNVRKVSASMPPSGGVIVHENPIAATYPTPQVPLDGRVVLEPFHGTVEPLPVAEHVDPACYDGGCDGLPGPSCGCGVDVCDGMCGVPACGGCDGGPCGGGFGCLFGNCCNGDPMCGQYNDCDTLQPCVTICWPQDGWFSAEYLLWWADGMHTPPLASTAALPGGQVLFGGEDLLTDSFDGFRLGFGFWLDNCHTWGIGADYFRIGTETDSFFGTPTNSPELGRPFQNLQLGGIEQIEEVNSDRLTGTLDIDVESELYGWGLHLRHLRCAQSACVTDVHCCPQQICHRTEYMLGFRQVTLSESIHAQELLTALDNPLDFDVRDHFRTRNQFNGIDLGILYSHVRGYWNFDAGIRLGVGNTRQRVRINGETTIDFTGAGTPPTGSGQTQVGGLLAQETNIGNHSRDVFSVLPQLDLKLGYQLTEQLRATVGYTFLYWSNVVRPGDHIDRLIDVNQLPELPIDTTPEAATFPEFAFDNTDYWAQGLSFGGEYRW
ncbi:MAG: BBP7 family outer membrane beta-barrel protein [Planctomycetota bacterium]